LRGALQRETNPIRVGATGEVGEGETIEHGKVVLLRGRCGKGLPLRSFHRSARSRQGRGQGARSNVPRLADRDRDLRPRRRRGAGHLPWIVRLAALAEEGQDDLADAAMGIALASTLDEGESFATLELHVNFLRPVWNAKLTAKGRIVSRGRTVAMTACDIVDADQRHIAAATGTQMILTGQMANGR